MKNILLLTLIINFGTCLAQGDTQPEITANTNQSALIFSGQLDSANIKIDGLVSRVDELNYKVDELGNGLNDLSQAHTTDNESLSRRIDEHGIEISNIEKKNWKISQELKDLQVKLNTNSINIRENISNLEITIASLTKDLEKANISVTEVTESSFRNSSEISDVTQSVYTKQIYGIVIFILALFLILVVYIVLSNKWNADTKKINTKQNEIFEKQIQDSIKLSEWLANKSEKELDQSKNTEPDHSFAKRVADEIVRMRTNLSRMDESIKGFKQLSASVRKLEQSLNSNQYELEDLLNKPYNEGMNLQATFVEGENLKAGDSIITRIIKPQINFKGKLIQAAQVEVSEGF